MKVFQTLQVVVEEEDILFGTKSNDNDNNNSLNVWESIGQLPEMTSSSPYKKSFNLSGFYRRYPKTQVRPVNIGRPSSRLL